MRPLPQQHDHHIIPQYDLDDMQAWRDSSRGSFDPLIKDQLSSLTVIIYWILSLASCRCSAWRSPTQDGGPLAPILLISDQDNHPNQQNTANNMRILRHLLTALTVAPAVLGGLFGDSDSSSSDSVSSSSSSSASVAQVNTLEVAFLLTLQAAQISSMSCVVALTNMTTLPIGSCINLPALASLVVGTDINGEQANGANGLFSDQLAFYLESTCSTGGCTQYDISDAQAQLANSCQGQDVPLIKVLNAVLANYNSSFRTLACMIRL